MHLERRSIHDLPPGAIVISDKDALNHYHQQIYGPKKPKEAWPFKYGIAITSFTNLATGFWLTNHYITRFRITGPSAIFFFLLGSGMPSVLSLGSQYVFIQPEILLQKLCTTCVYTKCAIVQNIFGVFYPVGPVGLITLLAAGFKGTYDVPEYRSMADVKTLMKKYMSVTQKIYPRILICVILNSIAAAYVTSKQFDAFDKINIRLRIQDEKLRQLAAEYESRKAAEYESRNN